MFVYLMMMDSQEDQSKFENVYLTYRGLMYHVAYKILNNKHDAEDVVHSAFIKVAENIQKRSTQQPRKCNVSGVFLCIAKHTDKAAIGSFICSSVDLIPAIIAFQRWIIIC